MNRAIVFIAALFLLLPVYVVAEQSEQMSKPIDRRSYRLGGVGSYKVELLKSGLCSGKAHKDIARQFGKLLNYPEAIIEGKIK